MIPKLVVALIWVGSIAAWFMPWSGLLATVLRWTGPFMAVAHVVEFVVYREVLAKAGGSTAGHFLNTFLFGVVHINPLREAQQGTAEAG